MILVKTPQEISVMAQGGKILAGIRDKLLEEIRPGAIPLEIDDLAKKLIAERGGEPSFTTVEDYQWATCICINDCVVHGIPGKNPLKEGDIVGLDIGMIYKGWHTDTSVTKLLVSQIQNTKYKIQMEKFLEIGKLALNRAIEQVRPGNRIGHISQAIQNIVEGAGFSVVKTLVGHGIGRDLHEPPQIPGRLDKPIENTPLLKPGMVLAIEVIYNQGKPGIIYKNDDGWTLATVDGSVSGLFEHTVAITEKGHAVLT